MQKKPIISWCLYDWANSAFPSVITTFIFATYFTRGIAPDEVTGTAIWGNALAISGVMVAVMAPVLGAIADHGGARKPWLFLMTLLCVIPTGLLWFAIPDPSVIPMVIILIVLALAGFEFGMMFYNAMLADIVPLSHIGRVSGWGWSCGYFGGLAALVLCLLGFVQTDTPLFGLSTENSENIRVSGPVVAIWLSVFAIPIFLFVPDKKPSGQALSVLVRKGISSLIGTLKKLPSNKVIARFLIARMIYNDGLATLFAFGGIYAAGTFGMSFAEVIQFAIALNIGSGLGAAFFAFMDDKFGSKPVIVISLTAILVCVTGMLFITSLSWFWALGMVLSLFLGPVQAASRTLMARLSPEDMRTEYFGLYALSGKATSFLGPLILGWVTLAFDSQRAGMATILVFLVIGLILILPLRTTR